ncbi:MAG: hypothetical protein J1E85_10605 [Ruminococcus sp.]|nr:hypothetical protein [Ruminococcus sp.]
MNNHNIKFPYLYSDELIETLQSLATIASNQSFSGITAATEAFARNLSTSINFDDSLSNLTEASKAVIQNINTFSNEQVFTSIIESVKILKSLAETGIGAYETDNNEFTDEATKEIEFTDKQLVHIENLNININNYCDSKKSTKNKKFFTFERIFVLINTLIAIIALFNAQIPSKQTEHSNSEIVDSENPINKATDILESILEQLKQSTSDEADAHCNCANNQ